MLQKIASVNQKLTPGLRKILGNTFWLSLDRILRMGLGLIVGVWVARYLGPQQFGLYNYAIAFATLFGVLATLGLDRLIVRDLVRDAEEKDEILGTCFWLKLIGGVLTVLLTILGIALVRPHEGLVIWLVGITAAGSIFQAFDTIDLWFQSQVQSKNTVLAKNAAYLIINVLKVSLIYLKAPLIAFAWTGLAEIGVGALGLVIVYWQSGQVIQSWRWSSSRAKVLLKESWPLIFTSFAIIIYMKIDQIMLGEMAGDEAVGIYSAATRISEAWYFIPGAIVSSVFPAIVEAKKNGEALYYRRLQDLFNLMFGIALAIAVPMTFLSKPIILLLFSKSFEPAGAVLAVHIWAAVFVFWGLAQNPWNITEGLTGLYLQRTVMGAVLNVLLNLVLIPLYSSMGAAIATVVAYGFAAFVANAFDPRTKRIFQVQLNSIILRRWSAEK